MRVIAAETHEVGVALFGRFGENGVDFAERTEKTKYTFYRVVRLGKIFDENGVEDFS